MRLAARKKGESISALSTCRGRVRPQSDGCYSEDVTRHRKLSAANISRFEHIPMARSSKAHLVRWYLAAMAIWRHQPTVVVSEDICSIGCQSHSSPNFSRHRLHQITCRSGWHVCQILSGVTRHLHIQSGVARIVIYSQVSPSIIRYSQVSPSIIRYSRVSPGSSSTVRYHQPPGTVRCHQVSLDTVRYHHVSSDTVRCH